MKGNWTIKFKTDSDAIINVDRNGEDFVITAFNQNDIPCKMEQVKHPEEYTYLDIDLPEWWDGRPIYGEAWDEIGDRKDKVYCFGIDHVAEDLPYACRTEDFEIYRWYGHFKPLLKSTTSAKVVITKDGKTTEVELTADQIERLGIK